MFLCSTPEEAGLGYVRNWKLEGVIEMAKLIYPINVSLDGYMEDERGNIEWTTSDDEVFAFWTDFQRPIGTYLYGRRMYESMVYWETASAKKGDEPEVMREFAQIWRAAEKIVYSRTLQAVSSARTRIEREFDPDAIRRLKESSEADITIGGPELAGQAMSAGLIDECHLLVNPIVLGGGKRALPDNLRMRLELLGERRFRSGVVHLHYRVIV
jgi:dihydrofolate reductase